jgi:hypothetical protein
MSDSGIFYVIDPVCAQQAGHNLASMAKYRDYLTHLVPKKPIRLIASKLLDAGLGNRFSVSREFGFYYPKSSILTNDAAIDVIYHNPYEEAISDLYKFWESNKLKSSDVVFYPSADYFTLVALCRLLSKIESASCPKIYLRLISVMEFGPSGTFESLRPILNSIKSYISKGFPIRISAESILYAERLSVELDLEVINTPVPPEHPLLPIEVNQPFCVLSPGVGRADKGFDRLPDIIRLCQSRVERKNQIHFIVQSVSRGNIETHISTVCALYANPYVELYFDTLTENELANLFRRSSIVIMPYDTTTYEYRSSAILTEAVGYGRQVIALSGTGFSSEIEYFGLGRVCADDSGIASAINFYLGQSQEAIEIKARRARERYSKYVKEQYSSWLEL